MLDRLRWPVYVVSLVLCVGCGGSEDKSKEAADKEAADKEAGDNDDREGSQDDGSQSARDASVPAGGGQDTSLNLQDVVDMVVPQCDDSVEVVTECGGVTCPQPSALEAAACSVVCCVDDACGQRTASLTVIPATECMPVDFPDERCPDAQLGPLTAQGCCVEASNTCGYLAAGVCSPPLDLGDLFGGTSMTAQDTSDGGVSTEGGMPPGNAVSCDAAGTDADADSGGDDDAGM
ncbi:MAG: hypothetical protein OXU20_39925 [Myxococcales bacterium]|nr:hypothetical protein [Myxococcales bacterium]MDD9971410.1 hypothetical protein [Myxococcales bacterium]